MTELVRRALTPAGISDKVHADETTGLPVVWVGRPVTTEMVRAAVDDE